MTAAIVLAAGKSERMGPGIDKAFLSLGNKPVLAWSLLAFERCQDIDSIILVVRKDQIVGSKGVARLFGISKLKAIVTGGDRRQDSVRAGLDVCGMDVKYVVIHDAARPCIDPETVSAAVAAAKKFPAVTLGRRVTDTIKSVSRGTTVDSTVDRSKLWAVQTPQAFQLSSLKKAYAALGARTQITDDCQAAELAGIPVKIVENPKPNIKITVPADLQIAGAMLK